MSGPVTRPAIRSRTMKPSSRTAAASSVAGSFDRRRSSSASTVSGVRRGRQIV
jgi:hypothetical protein